MDIHKPKPVHSWRELLGEIGVIVIGIVIALTGEQIIETLQWKHKVEDAETAMQRELGTDLSFVRGQLAMKDCTTRYFTRLEADISSRNTADFRRLAVLDTPFSSHHSTHPWVVDSWTAAINSQIPDHMPRDRMAAYAVAFRRVTTERERQFAVGEYFSQIVGARLIDNPTPEISYAQLVALDRLKATHDLTMLLAVGFTGDKRLGVTPDPAVLAVQIHEAALCEKQLAALPP